MEKKKIKTAVTTIKVGSKFTTTATTVTQPQHVSHHNSVQWQRKNGSIVILLHPQYQQKPHSLHPRARANHRIPERVLEVLASILQDTPIRVVEEKNVLARDRNDFMLVAHHCRDPRNDVSLINILRDGVARVCHESVNQVAHLTMLRQK